MSTVLPPERWPPTRVSALAGTEGAESAAAGRAAWCGPVPHAGLWAPLCLREPPRDEVWAPGRGLQPEVRAQPAGRCGPRPRAPALGEVGAGRRRAVGPTPASHWLGPPPRQ